MLGASQGPLGLKARLGSLPLLPSTYCVPGPHWLSAGRKAPTDPLSPPSQTRGQAPRKRALGLSSEAETAFSRAARCAGVGPRVRLPQGGKAKKTVPATLHHSPLQPGLCFPCCWFSPRAIKRSRQGSASFRLLDSTHPFRAVCLVCLFFIHSVIHSFHSLNKCI